MKHVILTILTTLALFSFSGVAQAQEGCTTPNNATVNEETTHTIEVTGLQANTTYKVIVAAVGDTCTETFAERDVTTNGDGKASWQITHTWTKLGAYAMNVSYRIGQGQPDNVSAGSISVNP